MGGSNEEIPATVRIRLALSQCRNIKFNELSEDQQLAVCDEMTHEVREAGPYEDIIKQGDPGTFFYVIEQGACDVYVNGKRVASMSAGMSFGELGLMYSTPCAATIRATTRTALWKLDKTTFNTMLVSMAPSQNDKNRAFLTHVQLLSSLSDQELTMVADALMVVRWHQRI